MSIKHDDLTVVALKETQAMRKIVLALAPFELRDKQRLLQAAILVAEVRQRRMEATR